MAQTHASAPLVRTPPRTAVTEYGIFWELWPQFVGTGSERQSVGLEVELIGSHTMDANHLDPTCPMCRRVDMYFSPSQVFWFNRRSPTRVP